MEGSRDGRGLGALLARRAVAREGHGASDVRHVVLEEVNNERLGRLHKGLEHVRTERVAVLIENALNLVRNGAGIVLDGKLRVVKLGLDKRLCLLVVVRHLDKQRLVRGLGEVGLLVHEPDETERLLRQQVDAVLVVHKRNLAPVDSLLVVLLLLQLKDVLVKVKLQLFVGIVDAKLLERVLLKVLKAENIKDADKRMLAALANRVVDVLQDAGEHAAVQSLAEGVPRIDGLLHKQGADKGLATLGHRPRGEDRRHFVGLETEQGRDKGGGGGIRHLDVVLVLLLERDVTEMEHRGEDIKNGALDGAKVKHLHGRLDLFEIGRVVQLGNLDAPALVQVVVVGRATEPEGLALLLGGTRQEAVENVVVAFISGLMDNARALQQKVANARAENGARSIKLDLDKLAETGRVVVTDSLGVTKGFHDRTRLNNLLLDERLLGRHGGKVLNDQLG